MISHRIRISCWLALILALFSWTTPSARAEDILVSAAASLMDVLREISDSFDAQSKYRARFNFGPSSGLARQIDHGAPADIFFSADVAQMDGLEKKARLEPGTRKNLLSNQLVIIVAADSKLPLASPKGLPQPGVRRIALAEPSSVPVGVYTSEYLQREGLWESVKGKIVPVQDVRATLAAVESGNVEAGFVYKTDAAVSKKVKIAYEVPIAQGPKITYPAAIVRESKRKDAARAFMRYLQSPAAKEAFKRHGFVVLD